ncbi:uncharacterized protein B0H64DRAFT_95592 [Chaetomium fimeti]|uniref:Uncharacterized protein n=1 Tax=Chaetomium fimeti TaxID=1854472 RepID=A0AAE0LVN7_9PEZI|nr:hypothetical protein B0H64DRAFT_95592 [Chaetomium fimeti]
MIERSGADRQITLRWRWTRKTASRRRFFGLSIRNSTNCESDTALPKFTWIYYDFALVVLGNSPSTLSVSLSSSRWLSSLLHFYRTCPSQRLTRRNLCNLNDAFLARTSQHLQTLIDNERDPSPAQPTHTHSDHAAGVGGSSGGDEPGLGAGRGNTCGGHSPPRHPVFFFRGAPT